MGFLSSIFDPGKGDRDAAAAQAKEGIITGSSFTGPGGISGGFDFSGGKGSSTGSLGSFQGALDGFQGLTQAGLAQAQGGLPPELQALGQGTIDQLGGDVNQLTNEGNFAGLGDIFQSSLKTAQADPFELGAGVSSKLRALSERRNNRKVNKMFDRLKASGKLSHAGGAQIAAEMDANIFDEGLKFDLAGLDAGRGLQSDAIGRAFGSAGMREQIGARHFGESMGINQFQDNAALQQFGVGSSMFDSFLRNQAQGANIAGGANSMGMALAQMPLAMQQQIMQMTQGASNTNFAAAGVHQQNAAMAKSPFLEALNAAGQFAGSIAPGGLVGNTPAAPSDKRLKKNLQKVGEFLGFNFYEWEWNDKARSLGLDLLYPAGLVAQEVNDTRPDVIEVGDDGYMRINYGAL